MDITHRKVLQAHTIELVDQVQLTGDFRALLYQTGLFTETMLSTIMAEKTNPEAVLKMLELLPTRGPSAFQKFLSVLEKDYPWLKENIQATLDREMTGRHQRTKSYNVQHSEDLHHNVKAQASSFLFKRFGQSRKISEKDKRAIEKWLIDYVEDERSAWRMRLDDQAQSTARLTEQGMEDVSSRIEILNLKLEACIYDSDDQETAVKRLRQSRQLKPEDAIVHLDQNINIVREKLRELCLDYGKCIKAASRANGDLEATDDELFKPGRAGMSVHKHLEKMIQNYEERIKKLAEEKELLSGDLKQQMDELLVENQELVEQRNHDKIKLADYTKEMYSVELRNNKLEEKVQRLQKVIFEQDKTIANLKDFNSRSDEIKDKAFGLRGQRAGVISQRTFKKGVLNKVNSVYLNKGTKPQPKINKKD